jgi:hypothetical protein
MFVDENISTLNYASQASNIKNDPIRNEDPKIKLINQLKVNKKQNKHFRQKTSFFKENWTKQTTTLPF